jgi:RHS repeat-associated protein
VRAARPASRLLFALAASALAFGCEEQGVAVQHTNVEVVQFDLVSERVLAPTVTESIYRARCRADAGPYDDAVVFATSADVGVQLVDAIARCGPIPAGGTVASVETIVLQRDPARAFDPSTLGWITLAYGPATRVLSQVEAGGARRLRYEVEITDRTGRAQGVAAGITSASPSIAIADGLVTASTQRVGTVRNTDGFEVVVANGASFDPAALVWSLSRGTRSEFALGVTRTLDGAGQPLGDVLVAEDGPAGPRERRSETESGIATLAESAGSFVWKFSQDGHLPVWRDGTLVPGQVLFVPSPWLPVRDDAVAALTVLNGGAVGGGDAVVRFGGGAFPAPATGTLTAIGPQSLPGLLPAGWSPLAAFWLELSVEPTAAGAAELRLADRLKPGERAFLVHFDESSQRWIETGDAVAATGDRATASLAASGAYAIVVPDGDASAPPAPVASEPLAPTPTPFPLPDGLAATGAVTPPVAAASVVPALVTAQGEVVVTHAGSLPSGLVLRADVDERYALRDGSFRTAPSYETFFVAYQRPGDEDPHTLHARFPLRPQIALGPDDLDQATIGLEVLPVTAFEGGFFDPSGGRVATPGVLVTAPPGAVDKPRAVELRSVDVERFADLLPPGAAQVAFELAVDGIRAGARVGASFGPQPPDGDFVLARFVQSGARTGLEPRLRYESDEFGVLRSVEPTSGPRLPGITGSGTYVLVQVDGPRALVQGVARDTRGQAIAGLAVTITGEPWLTLSAADGGWQLVAPPGSAEVVVTDLRNGDRGTATVTLADPASVGAAELATQPAGPRVVELDPEDGATGVRPSSPIRIVFSEAVAALGPRDVLLLDADGAEVAAILSTNLARTEATLLPVDPLASDALHRIVLDAAIADPAGLPLEGPREFSFTTAGRAARGAGAALVSWEPGAQTAACDDVPGIDRSDPSVVCVVGSQGTADPDVAVILVNDTTGATATVRSRADGSFESFIEAAVDDFVSATFVNGNGTRIRIPVQRQLFDDGSVALFEGGGILEAESDGGPVQILVQPGSIPTKTKFKVNPLPFAEVQALMQASPPEGGRLLSAVSLTISGDVPTESPEVSLPVDEADLQLQPGEDPATHAFALAGVTESDDGGKAYQVVDRLHYEDGKLVTHSFPFVGLALFLGQAVVEEFATIVITSIFLGDDAITTTGIVGTCQLTQVTGGCIGEGSLALGGPDVRPLPGAIVVAQPFEPGNGLPPVNARPGRIPTGAVYSIADKDGRYVLALALVDDAFGVIGREQAYQLVATHPRFASPVVDAVFFNDFTLFNPLADRVAAKDLLFRVPGGIGSIGDLGTAGRPRLSVGHSPTRPAPGEEAELRVFASHRKGAPDVSVEIGEVAPLVTGDTVAESDITLTQVSNVEAGGNARRQEWSIVAAKPAAVKLRVIATVDGAEPAVEDYPIHFGGAAPPVVDPVKAADPNDERGPFVLRSWPPDDSEALAPGDALFVVFNEAVSKSLETDPAGITLSPAAGTPRIELDPTQRQATIRFPELAPETPYTLTITNAVHDLADPPNGLDQDPTSQGPDSFQLHFETTPVRTMPLAGVTSGGGALLRGDRAYVLDRTGTGDGMLLVFDVSDPAFPHSAGSISLPGFPRDMALIPNYSFKRTKDGPVETRDLLAVVGGDVGAGSDDDGNIQSGNAYMNLFDVTDAQPVRLGGALLSQSAATVPTKVAWSPPMLTWLLSSSDVQSVELVNLQMFLIGRFASADEREQFPEVRFDGNDANQDGDFVDDDDELPKPEREPVGVEGTVQSFVVDDTNQRILDYFFDAPRLQLALALSDGHELDTHAQPTSVVAPASYRTYVANGLILPRANADVPLPGTRPKRVSLVYGVQTRDAAGVPLVADLAFVSLAPETSAKPALAVIDVTNPNAPHLLGQIELPTAFGIPQSVTVRDDGQLVLASTDDLLLLDPAQLAQPQPPTGDHPALLGQIDGAGSGARAVGTEASGMSVVSLGGRSQIVQSAPRLSFVQFPNEQQVVDPAQLAGDAALRDAKLGGMATVDTLVPGRLHADAGAQDSLDPPNPAVHYHVLVRAPGSAGETIELGLESLDLALEPIGRKGYHFAPAQALREATLSDLGQGPRGSCDAPSHALRAFRLAEDPTDPHYDLYLSAPFALVIEETKPAELAALHAGIEREILWSGAFLRAFLEPSLASNSVLRPWAAEVVDKRMHVRANALARSLPGDYIVGKNPPPPNGYAEAPGTMGTIAAHSGEMRIDTLDLAVQARLLPIEFERFSGSQDLYEGPFGRGWDFAYNQRITELREDVFPAGSLLPLVDRGGQGDEIAASKDLLFHTGEARTVVYKFASTGEQGPPTDYASDPLLTSLGWIADAAAFYLPTPGVFDALVRFKDGTFGRLTPDGMQYRYDAEGKLEKIYHRFEENALELQYNGKGELIRVEETADAGRYIDVGYYRLGSDDEFRQDVDETTSNAYHDGKIAKLVDSSDRDVKFHYDVTGLLESREGVDVKTTRLGGDGGRAETRYDWGQCTEGGSANNLVGVKNDAAAGAALFSISSFGSGERDVAQSGNGINGTVQISLTHPSTAEALANGGGNTQVAEPAGSNTQMALDTRGLPSQTTLSGPEAPSVQYQSEYLPDGRIKRWVEPEGNATTYEYDDANGNLRSRGNLVSVTREPGSLPGSTTTVATYAYDPLYNQRFGPQTDFSGNTITYGLTSGNREVGSISYPGVGVETFQYDDFGQLLSHVAADGVTSSYGYDGQTGAVTSETRGTNTTIYDPSGSPRGLPTEITPARAQAAHTFITYDELDRPVEIRTGAQLQEFGYDKTGSTKASSHTADDGQQVVERNTYDARGFLEDTTLEGVEVDGAATNLFTDFVPDALGRVAMVNRPGGALETLVYDHRDRIVERTFGSMTTTIGHDGNGNVDSVETGNYQATYEYDSNDRLHKAITPTGTVTYTYYGNGELEHVTVEDAGVVIQDVAYEVDSIGRRTKMTEMTDGAPAETRFVYSGLVTTITDAGGQVTTITRGTDGNVRTVDNGIEAIVYQRDGDGNVESVTSSQSGNTYTTGYGYDDLDNPESSTFGGVTTHMDARPDGEIETITNGRQFAITQGYTKLGELASRRTHEGVQFEQQYAPQREISAVIDAGGTARHYGYDTSLRQTETTYRDGSSAVYTYAGSSAHPVPASVTIPGGSISPTYDDAGRLLTQSVAYGPSTVDESFTYDALDRIVTATYPGGGVTYHYDKLGPLREAEFADGGASRSVQYGVAPDRSRTSIGYPSGPLLTEGRDAHARLETLSGVVDSTTYANAKQVGARSYGGGAVRETDTYDARQRLTTRRYENGAGALLAEQRIAYDAADNAVARQLVHRGGRADFFQYDGDNRMIRVDAGARPAIDITASGASVGSFVVPTEAGGAWSRGPFAREYHYDAQGLDLLETSDALDPDDVDPPAFARSRSSPDAHLQVMQVDYGGALGTFARGAADPLGNTQRALLFTRPAGSATAPVPIAADLTYDGLGRLIRIARDDGLTIDYRRQHTGLVYEREVSCSFSAVGCVASKRSYVYDGDRRIVEYDDAGAPVARYYYADQDFPIAADLPGAGGGLERRYLLPDALGSVMAVVDDAGHVLERIHYDAFGQPTIEAPDALAPAIARITNDAGALRIQFSERVVGRVDTQPSPALADTTAPIGGHLVVRQNGVPVSGTLRFEESASGAPFGTTLRFEPAIPLAGSLSVSVDAGTLNDEWNNPNAAVSTIAFPFVATSGATLLTGAGVGSTAPVAHARSITGSAVSFHGHFVDWDAGLVDMRARVYDPATGLFLQRDPSAFGDGVNLYAAFGHNPATFRDPTGAWAQRLLSFFARKAPRLGGVVLRRYDDLVTALAKLRGPRLQRLNAKVLDDVTPTPAASSGPRVIPNAVAVAAPTSPVTNVLGRGVKARVENLIKHAKALGKPQPKGLVIEIVDDETIETGAKNLLKVRTQAGHVRVGSNWLGPADEAALAKFHGNYDYVTIVGHGKGIFQTAGGHSAERLAKALKDAGITTQRFELSVCNAANCDSGLLKKIDATDSFAGQFSRLTNADVEAIPSYVVVEEAGWIREVVKRVSKTDLKARTVASSRIFHPSGTVSTLP